MVPMSKHDDRASPDMTLVERRKLGRYDTPRPLAQALADWAIRSHDETVLEPSCGGGVLVKSAIARLSELGSREPARQIWGCDIDPRALAETRRGIAPHKSNIVLGNFLGTQISTFGNSRFSAIVGNPPYVRLHTMDQATREIARISLPDDIRLDAKASLWAYFPIHAFKMLAPAGRMGWILPETVLHADYGRQLFRWAGNNFQRTIAVSLRERCFLADGAKERVVLLLLEGAGGKSSGELEMVEFSSAKDCIEGLKGFNATKQSLFPRLNGHSVPHLVSPLAASIAHLLSNTIGLKKFGDFAEVRIGVVTGDNDFFLLTEGQRAKAKLKYKHLLPVVSKFALLGGGFHFSGRKKPAVDHSQSSRVWLLCPHLESSDRNLLEYLDLYPQDRIKTNKTMDKRAEWHVPQVGNVPDAFFQYMGRHGPRIVLNIAGHYCTNTIHRVFFLEGLSRAQRRAICVSLHSSYSQLSAEFEGRQYGSGVLKMEPSEVKRLAFAYSESFVEAVSAVWAKLSQNALKKGWENLVTTIDDMIVVHFPDLAKALPLVEVRATLAKVRARRKSVLSDERDIKGVK
jgi:adenine-specific DNA-methyltransferase